MVIGVAGAMGRGGDDGRGRTTSLWKVHFALLVAQVLSGGYYVVTKVALVHGMNRIVLSLYRDLVALVFLLPAALFIERLAPQILYATCVVLVIISIRRRLGKPSTRRRFLGCTTHSTTSTSLKKSYG